MDTITHGIAGALIGKAVFRGEDMFASRPMNRGRFITWSLMLGAIFPDADVFRDIFSHDKLLIVTWHRSITHSLVLLRCQVTMSSLSCEKMSRKTSASGKIAPSINDQVMKRPRFIGREANMSSPRKTALPMRAPAMPCVIVSMAQVTVIASA